MQKTHLSFKEDKDNYNNENEENEKLNKDTLEYNELNMTIKQNTEYLNSINQIKSPLYDEIISEMYINIDLGEDKDDNSEANEENISILSNILKKFNENKNLKEKKKRTNKVIKDGMGLLLSLDVTEPCLLYKSYFNFIRNDIQFFEVFLYSINIYNQPFDNYGFIFPINFGKFYKIKLYDRKLRQIVYVVLKREKLLELNIDQMKDVIMFHLSICNQLIRGKKNIEKDNIDNFLDTLYKNEKYKKYFFVPIFRKDDGVIEIDGLKIDRCITFSNENFLNDYFPRINQILKIKNNTEENQEIIEYLKNCFLITDYRINRIYKLEDIILKKDDLNTFIKKYTFNTPELYDEIKSKLMENINRNKLHEFIHINTQYIMEKLYFGDEEEEIKYKETLGGIIGYRNIPQKYKINISISNKYYLSCKFGPSNFCKLTNFLYNINILKTNIETQNEQIIEIKEKEKEKEIISNNNTEKYTKILPPDRVFCHYIEQNDIDIFEIIPSIFITWEEMLKISQFINDFKLNQNKTSNEINYMEKNYHFLQWAFTLHSYVQDFNYETLETLGDSILKMLATTLVYHIYELNDVETNVDKLVFARKTLICNLHLFNKGAKSKIYNYIIRYPKEILSYTFPLEQENIITGRINISEKIIADIVESSIGGIFLVTRSLKDCFNYINKLDLPFVESDDYKYKETKGNFSSDAVWKTNKEYKSLVNKSCYIMSKKLKNFNEFKFPQNIFDIINNAEINNNINLRNLMEKYLLKCYNEKSNYTGDQSSLDYLQKCKIFYEFKDKKLLEQAMTHKSKNYSNSQNYEKLELLGDSIVEIFIAQYTFCIFGPYLFDDPNDNFKIEKSNGKINNYEELIKKNAKIFNNKFMTHIKSYLCSNYFMCKLSILIGLPNYLQFSENNINMSNQLKQFLEFNNISNFLESPLNNYISTEIYQPKFIADLFEALIGAIYIDSNLKTTYEFLNLIYGPSICYSCLYLEELPFSIVADFTEKCGKELKIVPSFKNVNKEEIIKSGLEYNENKCYLKLSIGQLFTAIDMGDNEEKAKENLSEKGILFLEKIKFQGPKGNN